MNYWYRIVRYPNIYLAISTLLVLSAMTVAAKLAIHDTEDDLNIPLVKTLGTYATALEGGTVNSRAMGAAILFGLENKKAKQVAIGSLPPDESEVVSTLKILRTQYSADITYLVNKQGVIVAYSSKDNTRGTGRDLSFRPYVQMALRGTANVYPAVGVISTDRGIYLTAPLRAAMNNTSAAIGAVVVKVGGVKLDELLKTWTDGTAVLLSPQGLVFAANRNDWLFRMTGEASADKIAEMQRSRQFGKVFDHISQAPLPFTLDTPQASIDGVNYAVRSLPLEWNDPVGDWTLAFLQPRAPWWSYWSVLGFAALAGLINALILFWLFNLARNELLRRKSYQELESAQTRLRASEARLQAILNNAPFGIWFVDAQGRHQFVNKTFCNAVGIPESKFLTSNNLANIMEPEAAASCVKSDRECLAQDEPHLSHETLTFVDGKQHLLEITKVKLHDDGGEILGAIGIAIDITEREEAAQQLNNLLAFNKTILDRSPAGIAVYEYSGQCIMANDAYAKTIGATVEDTLKQDFRNNTSWKTNRLLEFANQAFATGLAVRHNVEGTTTFGKRVVLECIFAPIDISGKPHLLVLTNDILDRVKAEDALKESIHQLGEKELAKTRFLAAAGHDLRQPLAAANLFIDALKFTGPTPEQNQIIQRLDQAMINFNGLLEALLNISKLDAGVIKPEYAPIKVSELFDWLEQNFALQSTEKKLAFKLFFPVQESMVVHSDIGLVKSVLINLVSNALKFTAKGAILVSARKRGGDVLFQVWDSGIGIPHEQIEHIFDEFYQINNPQRDRTSGLGLGLAIAKRALTLLGGKISCRSQLGHGSVFGFSLPLVPGSNGVAQYDARIVIPADGAHSEFATGKRFVVIEDDALVAEALCKTLRMMGGEVECFHNAEVALSDPNIGLADYYIVDYMLGGRLNGMRFLNQLRGKSDKSIKAVLVTGDTSPTFVRSVADCAWPVLHKPVNISKMLTSLSAQES